jgi:hypothetical protein
MIQSALIGMRMSAMRIERGVTPGRKAEEGGGAFSEEGGASEIGSGRVGEFINTWKKKRKREAEG